MGLEEVEKETARLVEGGWEEVGEQIHDLQTQEGRSRTSDGNSCG
jgi:hypothetical protein